MENKSRLAIIGGSGIYKLDGIKVLEEIKISTPFGQPSSYIFLCEISNHKFYFLPRHGQGHTISPSEINYRANIFALKKVGVESIISISAVGSLKEELAPTDFVMVDQFLDWTKGKRERTFFENGIVGHVSNADPVNLELQKRLYQAALDAGIKTHLGGSYICIEGPQFSTRAESHLYKSFGASVIGMTNVPEAFLAKEAGLAYATVAMVTDYDGWKEEHCTLQEIMNVMKNNYVSAQKLISKIVPELVLRPVKFEKENQYAVVTDPGKISKHHKEILSVIVG